MMFCSERVMDERENHATSEEPSIQKLSFYLLGKPK
jgi:hypothetical protein